VGAEISSTMLFPEEDAPQLKKWIVKRLENTYVGANAVSQFSPWSWRRFADKPASIAPMLTQMYSPIMYSRCYAMTVTSNLLEDFVKKKSPTFFKKV
jgi:hypothetical protein